MARVTSDRLALRALVALCVGAQLGTVGHLTLVTHTRCVEHGAMIHAGEHAHHAPTTVEPQQATDSWQVESMVKSDDGDHEGEHDHCLATHDRRKALRAAPAEPNLARTYAFGVIRRVPCDLVPVFERFRIAPKTSPPAA